MRALPTAALISVIALSASPQGKLFETVEVRVANIDVVVRDRSGNPVRGLTKDDFELYENGVQQTITNLYEVDRQAETAAAQSSATQEPASTVPAELRRRKVVIFVDGASIGRSRKSEVLAALEKFVDHHLQPDDQTMLVSWHLGLKVVTPFTSDKEALKRGIAALGQIAPVGASQQSAIARVKRDILDLLQLALEQARNRSGPQGLSLGGAYSQARQAVDSYSAQLIAQQRPMLEALRRMIANAGGLDGKKVLVFVSEHLPERPGAELYHWVYDQFAPYMGRNLQPDLQAMSGLVGNNMQQSIEDVARQASGYGITMYTIDVAQTDSDFTAENSGGVDSAEGYSRVANTAASLGIMSSMTGGVSVEHTSNFDLAFDTISRDLDSYYSLGYKPAEARRAERRIVVKAKNRAYSVRVRETLVLRSTDNQMSNRAIANLYSEDQASAWPIFIRTGAPRKEGRKFMIPVQVVMSSTITLLPQEGNLTGGLVLYFVVGGADGRTSEVMRRPETLKIPASAERLVRAKPMTFTTAIRVNPGESTLSVAIIDQTSGTTGFARAKIVAP